MARLILMVWGDISPPDMKSDFRGWIGSLEFVVGGWYITPNQQLQGGVRFDELWSKSTRILIDFEGSFQTLNGCQNDDI